MKGLNISPEIIKLPGENTGSKLLDIGHGNEFFNLTPKAKSTKTKASIKLKIFCSAKETINKMKSQSQHTKWKKIFVSHLPDKGSISRIYRLIQLRSKNKKTEPNERQTQTIQFKNVQKI